MSPRARAFTNLEEIAALLRSVPRLAATLDICHLNQNGYALDGPEVLNFVDDFRERIAVVHLSRPHQGPGRGGHVLLSGDYPNGLTTLLSTLSPYTTLVIEGSCPSLRNELLVEELRTLRILNLAPKLAA